MGILMRRPPRFTALVLASALLVAATARFEVRPASAQAPARDPLVVIIANAAGVSDIAISVLRNAFRGEYAEYAPGKRLLPFNHPPEAPERKAFDRAVLGLDPDAMGRYWIARRIRGEGLAPRAFPNVALGLRAVAAYPGAITYMRAKNVNTSVRVLTIDGHAPGQPNYPLPSL